MQNKIPQPILEAMNIRKPADEKAKNDTARPEYHFSSPSGLLLDVWGGIYKDNKYHLFYDTNYNNDPRRMAGAVGHLMSADMLDWQELPFALVPEEERGELNINDGFIVMDKNKKPLMFYTRCFEDININREHIAVRGCDDLLLWVRINNGDRANHKHHGKRHPSSSRQRQKGTCHQYQSANCPEFSGKPVCGVPIFFAG